MDVMQASAYKKCKSHEIGDSYGIRIHLKDRDKYFKKEWKQIEVEIDGITYIFSLTVGFWNKCPEFREHTNLPVIRQWLQKYKTLQWERNKPPQVKLVYLGSRKFRLLP